MRIQQRLLVISCAEFDCCYLSHMLQHDLSPKCENFLVYIALFSDLFHFCSCLSSHSFFIVLCFIVITCSHILISHIRILKSMSTLLCIFQRMGGTTQFACSLKILFFWGYLKRQEQSNNSQMTSAYISNKTHLLLDLPIV